MGRVRERRDDGDLRPDRGVLGVRWGVPAPPTVGSVSIAHEEGGGAEESGVLIVRDQGSSPSTARASDNRPIALLGEKTLEFFLLFSLLFFGCCFSYFLVEWFRCLANKGYI